MKIRIDIPHHPYEIQIEKGCLAQAGQWLRELWQPQKVVIVTDNHVASLYAEKVKLSLEDAGFQVAVFDFLEGEERKNLTTVQKVYEFLVKQGLTRSDGIVALGGGVVGDLAGFVASTYMRGIHFVQIPTSLTAQVDSSIGGKTGVNTPFAKNMVGTFAQPDGVLIDPLVLETLGKRELIEGMGEVIEDELDNGVRLYLNFGHTIGHAIEATAGYGKVMHGEAVAMGMVQISKVAEEKGLMPIGITQSITEMCQKFGLPVDYENWDVDKLYQALTHDKKARGNTLKLVLVPELGSATIHPVSLEEMKDYLVK